MAALQNICRLNMQKGFYPDERITYKVEMQYRGLLINPTVGVDGISLAIGEKMESKPFSTKNYRVVVRGVCPDKEAATRITGKPIVRVILAKTPGMCEAQIYAPKNVNTSR